jgi:AcrR family transcriptional regulator
MTRPLLFSFPARERLDRTLISYVEGVSVNDIDDINIEGLALAAGVSRATAYRHFGDRDALLFQAAIALTRRHRDFAQSRLLETATVAAFCEEGFAYTAREIPRDKLLRVLLTGRPSAAIDAVLRSLALEMSGERIREGQRDGQVRDDLAAEELIDWILEQHRMRLDEAAARIWFRRFVLPVLRPQGAGKPFAGEIAETFRDLDRRVQELEAMVGGVQRGLA